MCKKPLAPKPPPSFDSDDEPMDPPKATHKKPAVPKPPPSFAASPQLLPVDPPQSGHPTQEEFDNLLAKYAEMERMLQQMTLGKATPPSTPPLRSPSSSSLSELQGLHKMSSPAVPAAVKTPPPPSPAAPAPKVASPAAVAVPKAAPPAALAEPTPAIDPEMERVYSLDAEAHCEINKLKL